MEDKNSKFMFILLWCYRKMEQVLNNIFIFAATQ